MYRVVTVLMPTDIEGALFDVLLSPCERVEY